MRHTVSLKMYDRDGEIEYLLGGDEVHFDPGSRILFHSVIVTICLLYWSVHNEYRNANCQI